MRWQARQIQFRGKSAPSFQARTAYLHRRWATLSFDKEEPDLTAECDDVATSPVS